MRHRITARDTVTLSAAFQTIIDGDTNKFSSSQDVYTYVRETTGYDYSPQQIIDWMKEFDWSLGDFCNRHKSKPIIGRVQFLEVLGEATANDITAIYKRLFSLEESIETLQKTVADNDPILEQTTIPLIKDEDYG